MLTGVYRIPKIHYAWRSVLDGGRDYGRNLSLIALED